MPKRDAKTGQFLPSHGICLSCASPRDACRLLHNREYNRKWRLENAEEEKQRKRDWRANTPGYWKRNRPKAAHFAVMHALQTGKLIRPTVCEKCGDMCKPQAHHEDYEKPLEVIWLCRPCHGKRHRK